MRTSILEFEVEAGKADGASIVSFGDKKYLVDTDKALGLIKEVPDHAKERDIVGALLGSGTLLGD